jgi:hypothetical protein
MDVQSDPAKGGPRIVPVQRDFLFVDAAQAKTSRQGRKNARSFVMQKARRERPWSTSKHAAKQRKGSESTSPRALHCMPIALIILPSGTVRAMHLRRRTYVQTVASLYVDLVKRCAQDVACSSRLRPSRTPTTACLIPLERPASR